MSEKWDLPPVPEDRLKSMIKFFKRGKALVGDRFPAITNESIDAWARALPEVHVMTDRNLDAVIRRWARTGVTHRMAAPQAILEAIREERKAWENSPEGRAQVRAHRRRMEDLRDQQLRDGTFAQLRGIRNLEITGPGKPQNIHDLKKQALEAIQRGKEQHGTG